MPINPAIEEKIVEVMKSPAMERVLGCESTAIARGAMNNFDGEILPDILRRTLQDIYQLGVSDGVEKSKATVEAYFKDLIYMPHPQVSKKYILEALTKTS